MIRKCQTKSSSRRTYFLWDLFSETFKVTKQCNTPVWMLDKNVNDLDIIFRGTKLGEKIYVTERADDTLSEYETLSKMSMKGTKFQWEWNTERFKVTERSRRTNYFDENCRFRKDTFHVIKNLNYYTSLIFPETSDSRVLDSDICNVSLY